MKRALTRQKKLTGVVSYFRSIATNSPFRRLRVGQKVGRSIGRAGGESEIHISDFYERIQVNNARIAYLHQILGKFDRSSYC